MSKRVVADQVVLVDHLADPECLVEIHGRDEPQKEAEMQLRTDHEQIRVHQLEILFAGNHKTAIVLNDLLLFHLIRPKVGIPLENSRQQIVGRRSDGHVHLLLIVEEASHMPAAEDFALIFHQFRRVHNDFVCANLAGQKQLRKPEEQVEGKKNDANGGEVFGCELAENQGDSFPDLDGARNAEL